MIPPHKPFPIRVHKDPEPKKGGHHAASLASEEPVLPGTGQAVHAPVLSDGSRRRWARSRSRRLRRKLKPASYAYMDPGKLLFEQPEFFVEFNVVGYQVTVLMEELMLYAFGGAVANEADPLNRGLALYLDRHLQEEQHHDEAGGMTLEDLATIGVDVERVRNARPVPQVAYLRGFMFQAIESHPVAVLGFLQLEQNHSNEEGVEAMIMATGLPRRCFRNLELHAHLDIGHGADLDRQLDTLPLRRWHEKLIYTSALTSITSVRAALLGVFSEGRGKWMKGGTGQSSSAGS